MSSHSHRVGGARRLTKHAETYPCIEGSSQEGSSGGCKICISLIQLKLEIIPYILSLTVLIASTYTFQNCCLLFK